MKILTNLAKFEILNPKLTQNLKSLTLVHQNVNFAEKIAQPYHQNVCIKILTSVNKFDEYQIDVNRPKLAQITQNFDRN